MDSARDDANDRGELSHDPARPREVGAGTSSPPGRQLPARVGGSSPSRRQLSRAGCKHPHCPGEITHKGEHVPGRVDSKTNRCRVCGAGAHWLSDAVSDKVTRARWIPPDDGEVGDIGLWDAASLPAHETRALIARCRAVSAHEVTRWPRPTTPKARREDAALREIETLIEANGVAGTGGKRKMWRKRNDVPSGRWEDNVAYHGMQEGTFSVEQGPRGAPAHRPRRGISDDTLLVGLVYDAVTKPLDVRRIAEVTHYYARTQKQRERICCSLWLARLPDNVNVQALAASFDIALSTLYRLRGDGKMILQTAATLERLERKLDCVLELNREMLTRVRELYPTDAEVSEAVDRLLEAVGGGDRTEKEVR